MTLAEHIIEATPDRIKRENFVPMESPLVERTDSAAISTTMSWLASYLADVDHLPSAAQIRSVRAVKPLWVFEWSECWAVCTDSLYLQMLFLSGTRCWCSNPGHALTVKCIVASTTTGSWKNGSACSRRGKWPRGLTCDFSSGAEPVQSGTGRLRSVGCWLERGRGA